VLMAADILLYGAEYVPVGDDQTQHLEFTRDIAVRLNKKFGELVTVPKPVKEQHEFFGKEQGLRIKDLIDPSKKMSKSDTSERGIIFLGDDPEDAAKKVMGATTDSEGNIRFDFEKQPGVSNLIQIQSLLLNQPLEETIRHWEGKPSYGDLKREVAELVKDFLTDFQSRLHEVNDEQLAGKLEADERAMNDIANGTLYRVQQAVGLRPKS
jgi:tryptophanyl-tRNA synthetase